MYRAFLIVVLLSLAACAQPRGEQPQVDLLRYVGGQVGELINAYGAPVEAMPKDAPTVYRWDTRQYKTVTTGGGGGGTGGAGSVAYVSPMKTRTELVSGCIFVATVNRQQIVSSISFSEECT